MRLLQPYALLLTLLGFSAPACAAPPTLTFVPDADTIIVGPKAARCVFPARSLTNQEPLKHTFKLRNSTRKPLTIARASASCECVQAMVGEGNLPVQVLPGQTVPVRVTLSVRRLVAGHFSRSATLYLRGGDVNGLRLEMTGILHDDTGRKP